MSSSSIILQLSIWSIVLPLVAGLFFYKSLDEPSRIIFYLMILAAIPQLLTIPMDDTKALNVVYNLYTPIEFLFIYLLIGIKIQIRSFRIFGIILIIIFSCFASYLILTYGLYNRFLNELVCGA